MATKQAFFDGATMKAINPWDLDSNTGWTLLTGNDGDRGLDLYFSRVPWLYRSIKDRALNVGALPWAIYRKSAEVANSTEWSAKPAKDLDWLKSPKRLFSQIEQSLAISSRAYLFLEVNPAGYIKSCRYVAASTITEVYDKGSGELTGYERSVNGRKVECTKAGAPLKQGQGVIVAVYDIDHNTEVGPAKSSAAMAALSAAGVLFSADYFTEQFFSRGAIKASILSVEGGTESEAQRLQRWWEDVVAGIKNAWSAVVTRAKVAQPIVVGEGLESQQNDSLSKSRRQDICTALGVPESRLWSSAANYATRDADEKAYFRGTIIPEFDLIAEALNEQVFTAQFHLDGYRIESQPETLDIFQSEEVDRSASVTSLVNAGMPLKLALEVLGYDLTDAQWAALALLEKEDEPEPTPPQLQPFTGEMPAPEIEEPEETPITPAQRKELDIWRRKANKALKAGVSPDCEFTVETIPALLAEEIHAALADCKTAQDVGALFDRYQAGAAKIDPLLVLADEIRAARLALEAE